MARRARIVVDGRADRVRGRRLRRGRDRPGRRGAGSRRVPLPRRRLRQLPGGGRRRRVRPDLPGRGAARDGRPAASARTASRRCRSSTCDDLDADAGRPGGRRSGARMPSVVVIGSAGGRAAPSARPSLMRLTGIEVVGIYPGPAIVAREPGGMLHLDGRRDRRRDRRRRAPAGLRGLGPRRDRHRGRRRAARAGRRRSRPRRPGRA